MPSTCHAIEVDKTLWDFCPSEAASWVMLVCFILTTCAHAAQTIKYHKPYCWTITISGLFQALAYLFRILSIRNPASLPLYASWFVLILIAPIWTNAFVYMVLGRMAWNFTKDGKILGLSAWRLGQIFVGLDIIAAIIQICGAASASDIHAAQDVILRGLHIYMAGIGFQLFFICIFFYCAMSFHKKIGGVNSVSVLENKAVLLLYVLYIAVFLIGARIIFRLVEYSSGLNSAIPRHEVYQYCLDTLLMLIASAMFNIVHAGAIMPGKDSDFPTRKERKQGYRSRGDSIRLGSPFTAEV